MGSHQSSACGPPDLVRDYVYSINVLVAGNRGVGKSMLVSRFLDNSHYLDHCSFQRKPFDEIGCITVSCDGDPVRVKVWDVSD